MSIGGGKKGKVVKPAISMWKSLERPYKLLFVALSTLVIVAAVEAISRIPSLGIIREVISWSKIFGPIFFPGESNKNPIEWKDRIQSILLLVGLPVAFLLWHWRDKNVRDQIENSRKDTNLTEFLEVQKMASGLFEKDKFDSSARDQLQIAALHQLRRFLRGEYGESFRTPAFELLMSGHADAIDRVGVKTFQRILDSRSDEYQEYEDFSPDIYEAKEIFKNRLSRVDKERIKIISMEFNQITDGIFMLDGKSFDFLDLKNSKIPAGTSLQQTSFFGASFYICDLTDVNFEFSQLQGIDFYHCVLSETRFWQASMDGAMIRSSVMFGTNLAIKSTAAFPWCDRSVIDDECWMAPSWGSLDEDIKTAILTEWLEAGVELVNNKSDYADWLED